jgi:hypothetical protein
MAHGSGVLQSTRIIVASDKILSGRSRDEQALSLENITQWQTSDLREMTRTNLVELDANSLNVLDRLEIPLPVPKTRTVQRRIDSFYELVSASAVPSIESPGASAFRYRLGW